MRLFRVSLLHGLVLFTLFLAGQDKISDDFCVFQEEYELVKMINEYRATFSKSQLNLSNSLCFVAHQHNTDLFINKPDTLGCNMHSWSEKGNWTPCCYNSSLEDKACLYDKPMELTDFPGSGFELIFWDSKNANAIDAFDFWRSIEYSRSVLLNENEPYEDVWKSIGVSIEGSYAIVWLSTFDDVENLTRICNSDQSIAYFESMVDSNDFMVKNASGRFYLISASMQNIDDAIAVRNKMLKDGFLKTKLIVSGDRIRVSVDEFLTKEAANNKILALKRTFPDIWVLQY